MAATKTTPTENRAQQALPASPSAPAQPRAQRNRRFATLAAIAVVALLAILGTGYMLMASGMAMSNANTPPPDLDTSWTQTSSNGLYRGTVAPSLDPITINKLHSWRLHLQTADGKPVDNATFTISGDMPGHGHGLPTQPAVTQNLGNGDYLVEGMKFQMTGWWYVQFGITSPNGSDTLRFNLILR